MGRRKKRPPTGEIVLYEVVSNDEYELPVFVGTIDEVSEYTGRTKGGIYSSISHRKREEKRNHRKTNRIKVVRAGKINKKDIFTTEMV